MVSNTSESGTFITLEGSEGSGKTTSLQYICGWLQERDIEFIVTREPGGTAFGEKIREMLLFPETDEPIDPIAELLIIFAARRQHITEVIKPALEAGSVVLCDRFTDTTWAYQCGGQAIEADYVRYLENMVQETLQPDITLLFDIPIELGLQRAIHNAEEPDRFEREHRSFFERVRKAYLERAQQLERFHLINGDTAIEAVHQQIASVLSTCFAFSKEEV